jgi:flagellar hook-basal body complex protein FliE
MIDPIAGIGGPKPVDMISLDGKAAAKGPVDFSGVLRNAVDRVEQFQQDGRQQVDRFLAGEDVEVHDVVMAAQRAELAFDFFLQVRNKVVQAYQEVMRMQI